MAKWSNDHASLLALSNNVYSCCFSIWSDLTQEGTLGSPMAKGSEEEGSGFCRARGEAWGWLLSFNLSLAFQFLAWVCRLEPWIRTGTSGYSTTLKRLCSIVLVVGFSLDTGILTWLGNGTEKAKVQHRKVDYDKHTLLYFLCFGGFCTARQNFQFGEKASWVE